MKRAIALLLLLAIGLAAAPQGPANRDIAPTYDEAVASLRETFKEEDDVLEAIQLLEAEAARAGDELSPELAEEMRAAVARELHRLSRFGREHEDELRASVVGNKCISLAKDVMALPYRRIPPRADRQKAALQLTEVIDRLDRKTGADPRFKPLRASLMQAKDSIFSQGHGRVLFDEEVTELNKIIDDTIAKIEAAPKQPPPGQPDVAMFSGMPVFQFFVATEPNPNADPEYRARRENFNVKARPMQRRFMKAHAEQFKKMIEAAKEKEEAEKKKEE